MYAVVKTSGRQYKVSPGDSFSVEKLEGAPGSTLQIKEVLMVGGDQTLLGSPFVSGATVTVVIEKQYRGPKIIIFKKKRRHKYRNKKGHRSELTSLFVSEIATPNGTVKADTKPVILDEAHAAKKAQRVAEARAKAKTERHAAKSAGAGSAEDAQPVKAKAKSGAKSKGAKKAGTKGKASSKMSATQKKKAPKPTK